MRKLTIPAVALGVLTLSAMGAHNPASAAGGDSVQRANVAHGWVLGEDDGDDDDGEEATTPRQASSGEAGSGSGELAATGGDASSIALIGAARVGCWRRHVPREHAARVSACRATRRRVTSS